MAGSLSVGPAVTGPCRPARRRRTNTSYAQNLTISFFLLIIVVIRVCESLRSITPRGYVQDKNNLRRIWRARGIGTHSYLPTARYTRGTSETATRELQQFQQEKMVPGVGVEL